MALNAGAKRKGTGTSTGKKVTKEKASGGAVSVTPAKETASASTGKEVSFQTASPRRRAATGIALENESSPVKETIMNGERHATTTSKSFSCSSSSNSSSDDESDDTNENRRKEENQRNYEQRENGTGTATNEEMYQIAQGNMGAIKNDTREATKAFAVARDLVYSWMKFLDEDQFNSSDGIVASFISDQLNLFPEETSSMSIIRKDNLRMGKNAWWLKVNGFVRDAINNSRAYACAKLRKGLRRMYFKNKGDNIPDLHDIMKGCENTDIDTVCIYFDVVVVASQLKSVDWKEPNQYQLASDLCTESDEAMGLLMLENSWDKWMEDFEKEMNGEITAGDDNNDIEPSTLYKGK
eukprot:scaffold59112_cov33-Attheya_sp.AAC.1